VDSEVLFQVSNEDISYFKTQEMAMMIIMMAMAISMDISGSETKDYST